MLPAVRLLLLLLACSLILEAWAADPPRTSPLVTIQDDRNFQGLIQALEQSLIYLDQRPGNAPLNLLGKKITPRHLIKSLLFFQDLIRSNPSPELLTLEIHTYFDLYRYAGSNRQKHTGNILVTGYYQPVFAGSLIRKAPYLYPVYGIPDTLVQRRNHDNTIEIGRLQNGQFLPYWTRQEIEQQGHCHGFELVYLKDPLDAFLLHIQGSGLIRLPDGTLRSIHYAMKNGRPYRSIGKFMIQTGKIDRANMGLAAIRQYLASHPDEIEEILQHNPSFIFFRWSDTHGAIGNLGRPLTAHRSVAVDQRHYPAAGLALLKSRRPVLKGSQCVFVPFSRFVLAQDTGSAIRGPARVDLFWGTGPTAEQEAGRMKENGELYFLLLKKKYL